MGTGEMVAKVAAYTTRKGLSDRYDPGRYNQWFERLRDHFNGFTRNVDPAPDLPYTYGINAVIRRFRLPRGDTPSFGRPEDLKNPLDTRPSGKVTDLNNQLRCHPYPPRLSIQANLYF